ncbi:hypothetical protein Tco_1027359 [Tanacetum coccineum]
MKRVNKDISGNDTSLFPTMVVQTPPPHPITTPTPTSTPTPPTTTTPPPTTTPTPTQPTPLTQPLQPRKQRVRRKGDTEVTQPSEPNMVVDEDVLNESNDPFSGEGRNEEMMFDAKKDLAGEEVMVEKIVAEVVTEKVNVEEVNLNEDEITLAKTLQKLKATPKAKSVTIREPKDRIAKEESQRVEEWDNVKAMMDADYKLATKLQVEEQEELTIEEKSKIFVELMDKRKKHFAAKRAEELRRKPPKKAQKRKYMSTYLKNMAGWKLNQLKHKTYDEVEKLFDQAMVRVNNFVDMDSKVLEGTSKRAGSDLEQEAKKKQNIEDDKETTKLQLLVKITPDEEEVAVDAIPLATKPSAIVDYRIYKEGRTSYYKITRADGKYMLYTMFSLLLKSFDREDLEPLWKLVKARHGETRP